MTSPVVARAVDGESLDRVVAEIRAIDRNRRGLERTLVLGELLLSRLFCGSIDMWRDRTLNKGTAIRRLADRDGCPYGRSALNEAVSIFVAVTESPAIRTLRHIQASHVAAVLALPAAERERLLRLADRERIGVRALRTRIIEARRASGERRGRPRLSPEQRLLVAALSAERRLAAAVEELEAAHCPNVCASQHFRTLANRLAVVETRVAALSRGQSRSE